MISDLAVDPENPQVAYAVRSVFGGGHVFRTTNGGSTWTNITGNLPDLPTNTIVLGAGVLYVGNDDGVYASTDSGKTWSRLGKSLPNAQVTELVLNSSLGILAAATHGRGMWELSLSSPATHFSVTASANPVTAGGPFQITVAALDDQNNPVSGYTGTVRFSSTDSGATLPADYTFSESDGGTHSFNVVLIRAGGQTITVADAAAGLNGTDTLSVIPAAANHFSLGVAAGSTAGNAFDLAVTALDSFNNIDVNYQGTVHFTTPDPGAGVILPPDTTFIAADAGVLTLFTSVTLVTAGNQILTVTDTASGITGSASVLVAAAAADHFLLAAPAQVVSGVAFDVTVIVQDAFNNPVLTYQGTVHFATSDGDPGVLLPPDYTFSNADAGMHTFARGVTLITVGQQTLHVDDPTLGIAGQAVIQVTAPAAPPGGGARGPGGGSLWQGTLAPFPVSPPRPALWPSGLEAADVTSFFMALQTEDRRGQIDLERFAFGHYTHAFPWLLPR
jgi:hypothetical protein